MNGFFLPLLSAFFFSISIPFSKELLNYFSPVLLSSLLYFSSAIFLIFFKIIYKSDETKIKKDDLIYLIGIIVFGGFLAPLCFITSLKKLPASTVSLLSNFELIFTVLISIFFLGEKKDKRFFTGFLIVIIGLFFVTDISSVDFNKSVLLILAATLFWAIDNNLSGKLSVKDPYIISIIKGIVGGGINLLIAFNVETINYSVNKLFYVFLLGGVSYGVSLVCLIYSFRFVGVSVSISVFNSYPFIAFVLSVLFLNESVSMGVIIGALLFATGLLVIMTASHSHLHSHIVEHEHFHSHNDGHHNHKHNEIEYTKKHSHIHKHNIILHSHTHLDDSHHRHH
jgi:drug/metabolite transporter (DMT)-like permease